MSLSPCGLVWQVIDGRPIDCKSEDVAMYLSTLEKAKELLPQDDMGSVPLWRRSLDAEILKLRARLQD